MKYLYIIMLLPVFLQSQVLKDSVDRFEEFESAYDQKTKAENLRDCRLDMNYYVVFDRYGNIVFADSAASDSFITYPAKDCYSMEFNTIQAYNNFIMMLGLRAYPDALLQQNSFKIKKDK